MPKAYQKHRIAKQAIVGKSKQSFTLKVNGIYDVKAGHTTIATSRRTPMGKQQETINLQLTNFRFILLLTV